MSLLKSIISLFLASSFALFMFFFGLGLTIMVIILSSIGGLTQFSTSTTPLKRHKHRERKHQTTTIEGQYTVID